MCSMGPTTLQRRLMASATTAGSRTADKRKADVSGSLNRAIMRYVINIYVCELQIMQPYSIFEMVQLYTLSRGPLVPH